MVGKERGSVAYGSPHARRVYGSERREMIIDMEMFGRMPPEVRSEFTKWISDEGLGDAFEINLEGREIYGGRFHKDGFGNKHLSGSPGCPPQVARWMGTVCSEEFTHIINQQPPVSFFQWYHSEEIRDWRRKRCECGCHRGLLVHVAACHCER